MNFTYKDSLAHASTKKSKSKYKGGFKNGKNTSEYNHDYYMKNKEKWKKQQNENSDESENSDETKKKSFSDFAFNFLKEATKPNGLYIYDQEKKLYDTKTKASDFAAKPTKEKGSHTKRSNNTLKKEAISETTDEPTKEKGNRQSRPNNSVPNKENNETSSKNNDYRSRQRNPSGKSTNAYKRQKEEAPKRNKYAGDSGVVSFRPGGDETSKFLKDSKVKVDEKSVYAEDHLPSWAKNVDTENNVRMRFAYKKNGDGSYTKFASHVRFAYLTKKSKSVFKKHSQKSVSSIGKIKDNVKTFISDLFDPEKQKERAEAKARKKDHERKVKMAKRGDSTTYSIIDRLTGKDKKDRLKRAEEHYYRVRETEEQARRKAASEHNKKVLHPEPGQLINARNSWQLASSKKQTTLRKAKLSYERAKAQYETNPFTQVKNWLGDKGKLSRYEAKKRREKEKKDREKELKRQKKRIDRKYK